VQANARGPTGIGVVEAVVDALAQAGLASDSARRLLLIQLISDELGQPLIIPDQAAGRDHLIQIVTACAETTEAMFALSQAIGVMRPGSRAHNRIRRLVEEPHVLDLLPQRELDWLRERLFEQNVPRLPILVRRAAGPSATPAWHGSDTDTWDALQYLVDINAGADGLPPLMLFVDLIADRIGGELSKELTAWNDRLARRLNLGHELQVMRETGMSATVTEGPLHLVVAIRHDGIDPHRYLMSYWRQDDPDEWPPACGGTHSVEHDHLEQAVDELVTRSEIAWANHEGAVALEFILPRALLNLPVHLWHKEHDSAYPRPLCLDYPVVVRSLERMRSAQWHRVWRMRWQALTRDPASARVYYAQPHDTQELHRLDALLRDPRWALMVLSAPPQGEALPGGDELTTALRSGLPTLMWGHDGEVADDLRDMVVRLSESNGLGDLPARVQAVRQDTFLTESKQLDINLARSLVVLWDDPRRLVVFE
jgi:vWA-MoxR associated protein C-terminal domain/vWA-MoxR associated protein middle region 0/Effector-associated domain 2